MKKLEQNAQRVHGWALGPMIPAASFAVFLLLSCLPAAPASAQGAIASSIGFTVDALTLEEGATKSVTIVGRNITSRTTVNVSVKEGSEGRIILHNQSESGTKLKIILDKDDTLRITVESPQNQVYERKQTHVINLRAERMPIQQAPEIGSTFRDCINCPEMIVVRPGSFLMGAPQGEQDQSADEVPAHKVTITHSFAVGVFEITFDEWDYCVKQKGCNDYRPDDRDWKRGRRPVIFVSWDDAKAYVEWLSRKTKKPYRLLTEAEWEYVARAGTTTPYYFGNAISANQANFNGNLRRTTPVGSYPANDFGLHDVHGNVWEWVEDCYHNNYGGAPDDGRAWTEDCADPIRRVLRGGSWRDVSRLLRSAYRDSPRVVFRTDYYGFRVALTLTQ